MNNPKLVPFIKPIAETSSVSPCLPDRAGVGQVQKDLRDGVLGLADIKALYEGAKSRAIASGRILPESNPDTWAIAA